MPLPHTLCRESSDSLHTAPHSALFSCASSSSGQQSPCRHEAYILISRCQQLCLVDERVWTVSITLPTQHRNQRQMPSTRLVQATFEAEQLEYPTLVTIIRLLASFSCSEAFS